MSLLDRCTSHLRHVIHRARVLAGESGDHAVAPIHLLLALTLERGSIGQEILAKVRVTSDATRLALERSRAVHGANDPGGDTEHTAHITAALSRDAKRAIEKAVLTAVVHEHRYVGTEHLITGLIDVKDRDVTAIFAERGVDLPTIAQHLGIVYRSTAKFPELAADLLTSPTEETPAPNQNAATTTATTDTAPTPPKNPALDFFAKDLTASTAHLDPVIGRSAEIERVIQVLCRRTKNNPILLGEPGVGKTAIVEGIARKIVERDVPDILVGKRILALDLALLVAGTIYRGEFESRLKQLLDEVRQDANIVLFIDEIHTIMGAGAASGSLDAANILKPALAKGEIRCIGATTYTEFKKHVENDPALERRFQTVHVAEPSLAETREILRGLTPAYEQFHRIAIGAEAIDAAVTLAERYCTDRRFPDKAIDLIDEAAARIRVHTKHDPLLKHANATDVAIASAEEAKRRAVLEERYADAAAIQRDTERIRMDAVAIRKQLMERQMTAVGSITARDVAAVVAQIVGLPVDEILLVEHERLRTLGDRLRERIIGQDEALARVRSAIQRAKSGLSSTTRPLASFLLLGPSGVGKTATAKMIAELLFQHPDACIRLDMSEFSEGFTISKLIGAPAGYVGYREGAKLTDAIRKRPASVVLFDEIEKAHPDVWNLLLQILEDGRLTDATGREVRFTNAIIVLTSNLGSNAFTRAGIGFLGGTSTPETLDAQYADIQSEALRELRVRFRPELLNRIDEVIVYRPLGKEHLATIVRLALDEFAERLRTQRIAIAPEPAVTAWIAERAFDPAQGARAVRHLLQQHVETPIATGIIEDRFTPECTIAVRVHPDGSGISVERIHTTPTAPPRAHPAPRRKAALARVRAA